MNSIKLLEDLLEYSTNPDQRIFEWIGSWTSPRQRTVLLMVYGLCGYEPTTKSEIARHMELSRMRITQIQSQALRALQRGLLVRSLRSLPMLDRPIEELDLLWRTRIKLHGVGLKTIGQLVSITENELLKHPSIGRKTLYEIKEALALAGLQLNTIIAAQPHRP